MNRTLSLLIALSFTFALFPCAGSAQSRQQGLKLANQALEMVKNARSDEILEEAVIKYEKALKILERVGDQKSVGTVTYNLGDAYRRLGRYDKAADYYKRSLAINRKLGNRKKEADSLYCLGLVYKGLRPYDQAADYYKLSLGVDRKLDDRKGQAMSLDNLGSVYRDSGQYNKALDYYKQSLAINRESGNRNGESTSLNNLGGVYCERGQYDKAVDYYKQSLAIHRELGNRKGEAPNLNNLGLVHHYWGQYDEALDYYTQALAIQRKFKDRESEAVTLSNIGVIYSSWGQYDKAVDYQKQSLTIARKLGDRQLEATTLSNLGSAYSSKGDYRKALSMLQQSRNTLFEIGLPIHGPKNQMAQLYLDQGNMLMAQLELTGVGYDYNRGRLHLLNSEYEKAKGYYEKVLKQAQKTGNADNLFTAYTGLGRVHEALEDYENALHYYTKGMKLTEEIRSSLQPAQRKNFFDVRIGGFYRSEPAKGLTRVRLKLNQSAQSVESSEVTRARAFADGISRPTEQGYAGLPPEILAKEDRLVSRVAALKQSRNKMPRDKNPERYDNLTGVIEEAEKKLNSFVEMLWEKHRAYASVKYPRPVKLKESALRPEEHLVVFDVVGEGVGVKLIKGKKIISTFYVNWDLKDLEEQVRRFREPFEKMQLKDFDPDLGKTLYKKLLLRALVDVSEGTPLVTVPDGVLASLPFEVLVMGGKATWKEGAHGSHPDGLQYVGDVYPISYYQSITALTLARTLGKKKVPGKKLLVIADPVFSSEDDRVKAMSVNDKQRLLASLPQKLMTITSEIGLSFPRLTLTGDLGESLNKSYSGQVDLYTGMKAQKDLLFKKSLTEYRAIVFATHGYFGRDLPGIQEPVLALTLLDQPEGKDGFLRMSEVMGLELNADIVALTACQTGLGRRITGEGTMGMGRAFQYAGAKSVLMSLWNVAEKSSVKLVEYFFKHLKEGKSKLEALRLARKEIRETGYDHPFYWAPFILVGEID